MLKRCSLALFLALSLSGCASIDFDYPRTESYALTDTGSTNLGRRLSATDLDYPADHSGFHPLEDGVDALAARMLLATRAGRSIDVQYYLIKNDVVGRAFILSLLEAADRGVRVRLLLDDMFTSGHDVGIAVLDSHPNFEIRIFNPFRRGTAGRARSGITEFDRINRRMHNKSFTVDNQITVIGGRNIADEYFGARTDSAFGDLDVLAVGPVVSDVSTMFDLYWNHETALPALAFVEAPDDPEAQIAELRQYLENERSNAYRTRYANAVRERAFDLFADGESIFEWSPYQLVYDTPDKGIKGEASDDLLIMTPLIDAIASAKSELILVSPYFVPLRSGVEGLSALQARGIDVTVVTNSLAANNQFTVHAGYRPARRPLLENGISIYEVRPDATVSGTEFIDASGATSTLHTKAFVVDREAVFIGSFNFDPRSANLNTELGVIIYDADLGERFASSVSESISDFAYEVFLDENGKVRWRGWEDGVEAIYSQEPETSWWDRFKVGLVSILPIRQQL